jgi:thioredoxin 1
MSEHKAKHISDDNFADTIKNSETPVLVDFYAEWCGPCQMAAPIMDKLAGEYQGKMEITKLNVDENRQTAGQYGVMSIPTVMIFNYEDGEIKTVSKKVGFPGESGYKSMIEAALE